MQALDVGNAKCGENAAWICEGPDLSLGAVGRTEVVPTFHLLCARAVRYSSSALSKGVDTFNSTKSNFA